MLSRSTETELRTERPADLSSLRNLLREDLHFLLTNRIPRRLATRWMGWFSRLENPQLARASIALWRLFATDLDLSEAREQHFRSVHACFIRELKPGARKVELDPTTLASPCDAIIGAHGRIEDGLVLQAKGMPYRLEELLLDPELAREHRGGLFLTLRLKSSFYHRFHAPCDARLTRVRYISGDTWNVHPIALARIERLFCRNERAVLDLQLANARQRLTLVPVAAILVASIQLHCLPDPLDLRSRGANDLSCDARLSRGEELGWFQHGSTIVVLASGGFRFARSVRPGQRIRMGEVLFEGLEPVPAGKSAHRPPITDQLPVKAPKEAR